MPDRNCPSCGGAYWPGDPRGNIFVDHKAIPECPYYSPEMQTQHADYERGGKFIRYATPAERLLLSHYLGGTALPDVVTVLVSHLTPGARRREFYGPPGRANGGLGPRLDTPPTTAGPAGIPTGQQVGTP
ncbi:hypothetical protein [Georgenia sp. AZ-5]|uniref:hypothetical protein n=1 Tax=Georgenia sp. AZ-5 TaxID=3367526 RepID=UPI003754D01F